LDKTNSKFIPNLKDISIIVLKLGLAGRSGIETEPVEEKIEKIMTRLTRQVNPVTRQNQVKNSVTTR
jgi:sulfite exporter TauE/SafE